MSLNRRRARRELRGAGGAVQRQQPQEEQAGRHHAYQVRRVVAWRGAAWAGSGNSRGVVERCDGSESRSCRCLFLVTQPPLVLDQTLPRRQTPTHSRIPTPKYEHHPRPGRVLAIVTRATMDTSLLATATVHVHPHARVPRSPASPGNRQIFPGAEGATATSPTAGGRLEALPGGTAREFIPMSPRHRPRPLVRCVGAAANGGPCPRPASRHRIPQHLLQLSGYGARQRGSPEHTLVVGHDKCRVCNTCYRCEQGCVRTMWCVSLVLCVTSACDLTGSLLSWYGVNGCYGSDSSRGAPGAQPRTISDARRARAAPT